MPEGQLIIVEYNGKHNAFSEMRNVHRLVNVENKLDIAPMIEAQLKAMDKPGYILVKYAGKMFICERNNVDHTKPYQKHAVIYNPFQSEFTI